MHLASLMQPDRSFPLPLQFVHDAVRVMSGRLIVMHYTHSIS